MGIASKLDRQVQFQRVSLTPDGSGGFDTNWQNHGPLFPALRHDVNDTERFRQGQMQARIDTRFLVRSSEFTRGIDPKDRLICEGQTFQIIGVKQAAQYGRFQLIEITCEARSDGA
jgi:SPP1 family predicted phage head-tail adaptor